MRQSRSLYLFLFGRYGYDYDVPLWGGSISGSIYREKHYQSISIVNKMSSVTGSYHQKYQIKPYEILTH